TLDVAANLIWHSQVPLKVSIFAHSWIGSSSVTAQTLSGHFVQFTISVGGLRAWRSFMQLIWLACMWLKATSTTLASNRHSW
ncbi:hypothetical protein L195_g059002, partial [Trifolium pratense]